MVIDARGPKPISRPRRQESLGGGHVSDGSVVEPIGLEAIEDHWLQSDGIGCDAVATRVKKAGA